ncbi:hypothetical protein [Streptomyces niveus]|uniref:hypothetical protein n=1 Tax=Streptomyces niveus TaxID=193462 RepID=UPI00342E9CBB
MDSIQILSRIGAIRRHRGREKDKYGDANRLRYGVGGGDIAVLALPGEQVADEGVMREPYGFGQFSDAVRVSSPRMIH